MFWTGCKSQQGRSHAPINPLSLTNHSQVYTLSANQVPSLQKKTPPPTTDKIGLARLFTKTSKQCSKWSLFLTTSQYFFINRNTSLQESVMDSQNPRCWSRNPSLHANSFLIWWSFSWFSPPLFWSRASTAHVTPTSHQADLVGSSCTSKCYIM